ncbi:MAG TPA: TRZ/ATZ family hydrolase [Longimicrobiales bacterium]|nr:TRZ/ATZ family hydrolase [Longimicrobiales bacterium]
MTEIDLLLHAGWVVPVEPEGLVLEDHAVAVHDGIIEAILPSHEALARFAPRSTHHLDRHALIPGLVNAHTHAAMSLLRGFCDDRRLMDWLQNHIWPTEQRWVSETFVRDGTLLAAAEMLRGGTTCFNDMYFFPDQAAESARRAGIRASIGLIVIDFPSAWAATPDEYFAKGEAVHDRHREERSVSTAWAPHAPYSVSDASFTRIARAAEELDIPVHVHVHETAQEVAESIATYGCRPLERLARLGLLNPRLLAVHMAQLTDDEVQSVSSSGAHVVHCPEANLKLASGFCPVHRLDQAGANVALGTDGTASNNDLDMFGEMRTAALIAKAVSGEATAVPAARALHMATLAGARALGMAHRIGSLAPGKAADLVAVDLGSLESQPVYSVLSQLVYTGGRERVTDVWVGGHRVLEKRRLTRLDEAEVVATARAWKKRIAD